MKVYIVSRGEYSDYQIIAVFLSEGDAKAFVGDAQAADQSIDIEEWDVGIPPGGPMQETFRFAVDIETGNQLTTVSQTGFSPDRPQYEQHPKHWSEASVSHYYPLGAKPGDPCRDMIVGASVVSREHALKVATEGRQAWLREHGCIA